MYKAATIVICMALFLTQFSPAYGEDLYGLGGLDVRVAVDWIEGDTESPGAYTLGPGEYGRTLNFQGIERFYKIHVPPSYNPTNRYKMMPVVLVSHGGGSYPDAVRYESGMDSVANQKGFIVVYPAGTQSNQDYTDRLLIWNDGRPFYNGYYSTVDDVGFVSAVLDDLSQWFRVDSKRTYACGFSNGAQFTYRLAKQLSNRIAAIAAVAGHRSADEVIPPPPIPMPVMQFSGKQDPFAPYYGGSPQESTYFEIAFDTVFKPVEETISSWVAFNKCYTKPIEVQRIGNAVKTRYAYCKNSVQVVLWALDNGGHTWPSGQLLPAETVFGAGNINTDISASTLMWQFFSQFRHK